MDELKQEKIVKFFKEMLNVYEFDLIIDTNENFKSAFKLKDLQGGNLGGIEQENFYTLQDIIDRLDVYHHDYIYKTLDEKENTKLNTNDWEFIAKKFIENENIEKVLSNIDTHKYIYLNDKQNKFELQDIIKILDEEESFYKKICERFINTMSKEMLLEKGQNILHIFIEDEYVELKEAGKININNYEKYLDNDFNVYEYDSYQEFFNSVVKDEIAYDLNDLELIDENGDWCFYISFEELKKIGYGYRVKDEFPLLEKYIVDDEIAFDFYDNFTLEELKEFEETLDLYYEKNDIDFDENTAELYSKSNKNFNYSIISFSEGLITYEDFLEDYKKDIPSNFELSLQKVIKYFRENNIKDLMEYGSDFDEGLYKLSDMYKEILEQLNINFQSIKTEDGMSDGKYVTTIVFKDNSQIKLDLSAWNGIGNVTDNIESILEEYEKCYPKISKENEIKDIEI